MEASKGHPCFNPQEFAIGFGKEGEEFMGFHGSEGQDTIRGPWLHCSLD
jgi:hypothetical protein